jgi:hypothetical protein
MRQKRLEERFVENLEDLTVKSVATACVGLSVIEIDHASHANCRRSCTDGRVRVVVAYFGYFKTPRKVRGHDFAASFVENWLLDARIGRAKCLPVPKCCI